ncbi:Hypothetical predicted protein [Olea europaea subsp. europaea]|uniref:Uncharacterized protein n=1 Tax=Olea europaea subsp. europaea TaxID=158383 RepID=A0A8S0S2G5_OLEEU|nr:Hypothetical predicted protein [Olea europaea subsp. europaea]
MRKGSRKMWWMVPRKSKSSLREETRMDIEDILKMKLETIKEEPEIDEENGVLTRHRSMSKKVMKKIHLKVKMGQFFTSQMSLKESYLLFLTGIASKGGLSGLPLY